MSRNVEALGGEWFWGDVRIIFQGSLTARRKRVLPHAGASGENWKLETRRQIRRQKAEGRRQKVEDAGLPDTDRRDPHKPGESPALQRQRRPLGKAAATDANNSIVSLPARPKRILPHDGESGENWELETRRQIRRQKAEREDSEGSLAARPKRVP